MRKIDKLDLNGEALRKSLITSFERAEDSGVMTPKETADFVIYELSGEMEKSMEIANKLAKSCQKNLILQKHSTEADLSADQNDKTERPLSV